MPSAARLPTSTIPGNRWAASSSWCPASPGPARTTRAWWNSPALWRGRASSSWCRSCAALGEACFDGCDPDVAALARELGPEGRALLALIVNEDPARVPALIAALPEAVQQRIERLSPGHYDLAPLSGKLILVHGRLDPLIPYSESLALARAVPGSEVFLIDDFSHITPRGVTWAGKLQLIDAIQAVLARRAGAAP